MTKLAEGVRIVDADADMTERHDLFTSRTEGPRGQGAARREDRRRRHVGHRRSHVRQGGSGGTIDLEGNKHPWTDSQGGSWGIDDVHRSAWDPAARLQIMDDFGIDFQVIYPNSIGLGGQNLVNTVRDHSLVLLCVQLYNDVLAETQESSNGRLVPMPIMPVVEHRRVRERSEALRSDGLPRGVNMTSDPQDSGSPDLGSPEWDPFWDVCEEFQLPVHFHIGASQTSLNYFGTTYYGRARTSTSNRRSVARHCFENNSWVLLNSAYSGMFDRHPDLKMVSVESGVGWIPFMLEAMDYELVENAPEYCEEAEEDAVGVLPRPLVRDALVRAGTRWSPEPHRHRRRGQHHVRDRLAAPDVPLPESRSRWWRRRSPRSGPRRSAR